MKKQVKSSIFAWGQILVGLFLGICAYRMYLVPNEIAPGGFAGIGQLVNAFTGWSIGMVTLVLNVPLFALSLRNMGLTFAVRSVVAMVLFSLGIDHLWFVGGVVSDPMLASIFGGVMAGVGFGLILRGGATTGGTDMLATLVNHRFPVFKISVATFAIDAAIIAASGFVFNPQSAMLALISAFLFSKLMDTVLEGPNLAKAYYIISNEVEQIAERIMKELGRGCTALNGVGMYSRNEKVVLLCVINRMETMKLRSIVADVDKSAFVIATNVHEALGEGFKPHR